MKNTYRMKPVVLQAVQWKGSNYEEVFAFCPEAGKQTIRAHGHITIPAVEGKQMVKAGTWVLKDAEGNFYVRDDEHFRDLYEPTTMVVVTRWGQGGAPWLILKGTPEETRTEAEQYFDDESETLEGVLEEMPQQDFDNLGEFQG
jgi:hypothetical protein